MKYNSENRQLSFFLVSIPYPWPKNLCQIYLGQYISPSASQPANIHRKITFMYTVISFTSLHIASVELNYLTQYSSLVIEKGKHGTQSR